MFNEINELKALKKGSEKAFEAIYKRYSGRLYNFVLSLSQGDRYMAEETVQSAFIKLWEVKEQVDPQKSILSYISVIAKNILYNKYQRQTVEFLYLQFISKEQSVFDTTTEKKTDLKWLEKYIDDLIEQLPPSRKRIFIMSRKKELSTKEIAKILQISVSTVETQLFLATKFIRKKIEKNYDKLFLFFILCVNLT